ncbi:MAG: molybdopterin-synthase adenylyltransferase MoeB [Pseudomonadota bacterium]
MNKDLSDEHLLQYSRQIMLPQIDVLGQQKLLSSHVLMLGVGGLGCPALIYLATSGIGKITIVDPDIIETSNLQRQVLFGVEDIGRYKVDVARERLEQLNTQTKISTFTYIPKDGELTCLIDAADVVIDGTDNFEARYRHDRFCLKSKTPLISGAVIRFEGQVTIFDHRNEDSPCYHCLYPQGEDQELNCSENGVLGPVAGIIATTMATEAVKLIINVGELLSGRLLLIDALHMEFRTVRLQRDPECLVCAKS